MPDVIRAFIRQVESQGRGDEVADLIEGAWPRRAEERFELGEGELNGVEIGTVGREKPQEGAGLLDGGSHLRLLMHGKVIEDDDISPAQRRDQDLFDVTAEHVAVEGPVEDGRRAQFGRTQGRDYRAGLPMTARRVIRNPRAAETPGVAAQQIRRDAGLVDEDVVRPVAKRLGGDPASAVRGDIWAPLLIGVYGFF